MLYQVMMTVASFEIVKGLTKDCYAIVFGANTFVALGVQSCLTAVINSALGLSARNQFLVVGVYFAVPAVVFLSMASCRALRKDKSNRAGNP